MEVCYYFLLFVLVGVSGFSFFFNYSFVCFEGWEEVVLGGFVIFGCYYGNC